MKIAICRDQGSVLFVVLITCILIGITLGSYLGLVSHQHRSIVRAMAWNHALAVAEAGIEEGMAHLNANHTNRLRDGWRLEGTNVIKETAFEGSRFKVYIHPVIDPPAVIAEGYVVNSVDGKFLPRPRIVCVSTTNEPVFNKGLVARDHIDISGRKLRVDSFDSTDPDYSTAGKYDPVRFKDGGHIATNGQLIDAGNAQIFGKASTGPGGTVVGGANNVIGSKDWHAAGNTGAQAGWTTDDMNVQFFDVKSPFNESSFYERPQESVSVRDENGPVTYDLVLSSGNYKLDSIIGSNMKILVNGNATVLVSGNIKLSGGDSVIRIAPGANLNLYVAGASASFGGQGISNDSGNASAFSYWGLNSNTAIDFGGNAQVSAAIYAPYAHLKLGGGGNDTYDFMGAAVVNSAKLNGHFSFHYDEALRKFGPKGNYKIVSWNEFSWEEL